MTKCGSMKRTQTIKLACEIDTLGAFWARGEPADLSVSHPITALGSGLLSHCLAWVDIQ